MEEQKEIDRKFKKVLEVMLSKGFKVAAKDADNKTPLHFAAEANYSYAVKLLLHYGAKKTDRDKNGMTPYDIAESGDVIRLLR